MIKELNDYFYSNWNFILFRFDDVSFMCIQFRYMNIFVEKCYNRIRNGYLGRCNFDEELHIGMR